MCEKAMLQYLSIENEGWHTTHLGYRTYVKMDALQHKYIFPGLRITGYHHLAQSIETYDTNFSEKDIESYAETLVILRQEFRKEVHEDMNLLVHDLRRLNTSVYNKAFACKKALERGVLQTAHTDITSTLSVINLLKLRTDTLDLTGDLDRELDQSVVKIKDRVAWVIESFVPSAQEKNISITSSLVSIAYGEVHELFDLVPYLILDNAVKYSPKNETIDVKISQDEANILVDITSLGPQIYDEEIEEIFVRGKRGINAIESGKPGTGYGMYLAKLLCDRFDGAISLSSSYVRPGEKCKALGMNSFRLSVPLFKGSIKKTIKYNEFF